ncbi:DUF4174 domain-containing protein [Limimaricola hongkongensis]|uniref:Methylmalonyl-CoA epimerase n=1 Tax=Limimaricola hongkongensis DSM 17492 TaxID=1122180 RepID=A0A017H962_9RHOB|nr:DUF4174 domain-containing protein [Limimaricola hongkongensis]EYD71012.1 Methylmalonyl-CoA epimerase [Limimaricola hongkongensis DSM 17492]
MTWFRPLAALIALFWAAPLVAAQEAPDLLSRWVEEPRAAYPVGEAELEDFEFRARPIVVFADGPGDPQFERQVAFLAERIDELTARDVIVLIDTDPDARSPIRRALRPRGFAVILIGKDGRIAQRKPAPFTGRELIHAIDKLPLRQQEIRDANRPFDRPGAQAMPFSRTE